MPLEDNELGLTKEEQTVMDRTLFALEGFKSLEVQHPDEKGEFINAVHQIQGILAMRVVRRSYPKGWPTYTEERA